MTNSELKQLARETVAKLEAAHMSIQSTVSMHRNSMEWAVYDALVRVREPKPCEGCRIKNAKIRELLRAALDTKIADRRTAARLILAHLREYTDEFLDLLMREDSTTLQMGPGEE